MRFMFRKIYYTVIIIFASTILLYSQSNDFFKECEEKLEFPFISDGHDYEIELKKDDKGEFKTTFYGGSTYRIISCSNIPQGRVIYSIYDTEKNQLFCNCDYNYTNYWDFYFKSTIDCIIEVKFESRIVDKAKIKLLIGFKNK